MKISNKVPNLITLSNLFVGVIGITFLFHDNIPYAVLMILIASILDFLDGFLARILKAQSEVGKQLDSLADLISFGVLPGLAAYCLIDLLDGEILKYFALLIPVFSAIRLAVFNLDEEQKFQFKGVATPANAIFWVFFIHNYSRGNIHSIAEWLYTEWGVLFVVLFSSFILVMPLKTLSLKIQSFHLKNLSGLIIFIFISTLLILIFGLSASFYVLLAYLLGGIIQYYFIKADS